MQDHLLLCDQCQGLLTQMKHAAFERDLLLAITHKTDDGPVTLWVERSSPVICLARIIGDQLDGGKEFESFEMARTFALRSFIEMFPDHVCTGDCSSAHFDGDQPELML
jgi:hypothetical protein